MKDLNQTVNQLFASENWQEAARVLEEARKERPDDHWVMTQLGVANYEQRKYREALGLLNESLEIVPDCPLTLWNLAGTLAALDKPALALSVYSWIVNSKRSTKDDPCWESDEWTLSLKADCIYRIGKCYEVQGHRHAALKCFLAYLDLGNREVAGMYPRSKVEADVRALNGPEDERNEVRKIIRSASGRKPSLQQVRRSIKQALPQLTVAG